MSPGVRDWLMRGDPAVAWQVQRDLLGRARSTWQATRRRVATQGWGARLLAHRADDGNWGGGLYMPKWTSTFYTLRLLTHLGIPATNRACLATCRLLLDEGVTETGAVSLWPSRTTDTCVTAMLLTIACYFGQQADARVDAMLLWLLGQCMPDGGWNCQHAPGRRPAKHSSFHTTVSTLEALAAVAEARGQDSTIRSASEGAREFFLAHQLYRSSTTGEVVRPSFSMFSFPPRWYFDVLRGLEHFAAVDAPWDERLQDPVDVLLRRRGKDGTWKAQNFHAGRTWFRLEPAREPSRINTLRALRVVQWLERVRPGPT